MTTSHGSASPFVDDSSPLRASSASPSYVFESPFPSLESSQRGGDVALAQELFDELEDFEFGEALEAVAEEVRRSAGRGRGEDLARVMRLRMQPLSRRLHRHLDRLGAVIGQREVTEVDEAELDLGEVAEELEAEEVGSPVFEQLFGSLRKKFSKAFKGAVRAVKRGIKKGVKLVGQLALGPLLERLKRLVRPLLDRVLGWALDKLPAQYRGVAQQLAQRLGLRRASAGGEAATSAPAPAASGAGAAAAMTSDEPTPSLGGGAGAEAMPLTTGPAAAAAVPSGEDVELELDARLTELATGDDRADPEAGVATYEVLELSEHLDHADAARARFAAELAQLGEGDDPTPALEGFLPALLPLVRMGIKILGRKRVVSFLASAIGRLIRPLVGPSVAPGLGQAIADLGLRALVQAETGAVLDRGAVGVEALVSTVEDTVRALGELPAVMLESPPLLEAAVLEAFEAAAASNLPPEAIKPALRESILPGVWIARPSAGPRQYKKFTHVFEVTLSAQSLASVHTFGGRRLDQWMADALRDHGGELRAKVHLFEASTRTSLARVAHQERALAPYLGRLRRVVHPLTREAAAVLLGQPRLGRGAAVPTDARLRPGQRFYFLELARPFATSFAPRVFECSGEGAQEVARFRLSEAMAQRLATVVREGKSAGLLVHRLRAAVRGVEVPLWVWTALAHWLPAHAQALVTASDGPQDGVCVTLRRASGGDGVEVTAGCQA